MKSSKGFILLQDIVIFLLCSLLLLSAGSAYKMAFVRHQQSLKLSDSFNKMDAYLFGTPDETISKVENTLNVGKLVELQLWEDSNREKMVCNMFFVERE